MDFKIENLCGFLIRSKLMTPAEMQAMRQRWQTEAKDNAAQTPMFLKWLVAKNYATEYQASLLARGHVDDFFLGEYKILERIGRGRMAGVYKAVHPSGQVVAIKVLPPSRAKNAQTLARFQREARLAIKLKHPNVVRSFQVGETKGVHFLVMEYLEGEPLDEVLQRRKRLPPGEAVRLIHHALLGLHYIHEQGMVHRDLKPANLMLSPAPVRGGGETTLKSQVKILDIGLAREFFDENSPADGADRMELTGEGVLLGTPDYLAPEQARDPRNIDIRADIYSLGCTLYHLLTGQPPFPDKNILNQMIRHATETPKPMQQFVSTLPEGLAQIVDWMMAKQPNQRYPTPARAAQALEAFLMVANEPAKPMEESPQLKKFLTSLEMGDHAVAPAAPAPPRAKPPSSPNIPAAPKAPESQRKRKRRTGVKVPGADVPAAIPAAAPLPNSHVPAAVALPHPALPADAFDVDLVDMPGASEARGWRPSSKRDFLMLGIGIVGTLIVWGLYTLVMLVVSWFSAPPAG